MEGIPIESPENIPFRDPVEWYILIGALCWRGGGGVGEYSVLYGKGAIISSYTKVNDDYYGSIGTEVSGGGEQTTPDRLIEKDVNVEHRENSIFTKNEFVVSEHGRRTTKIYVSRCHGIPLSAHAAPRSDGQNSAIY